MTIKNKMPKRIYKCSDGMLDRLASYTLKNINRDQAKLATRGIDAASIANFELLYEAFKNTSSDVDFKGLKKVAVEDKNDARNYLMRKVRTLRTACQNTFNNSATYQRFGFENFTLLRQIKRVEAAKKIYRVGLSEQAALAAEGISMVFLGELLQAIKDYREALLTTDAAKDDRFVESETRIEKGNILYKEIVRLCNIGKEVFAPTSKASYNCYVIKRFLGN
jgi:tetratricopeptide (TPR) repeat protein